MTDGQLALSMGVATALASVAYVAVFFMIAILTRNSIIVGLLYALLWEGVLAGYVPGVRAVSIRQWALAPAEQIVEGNAGDRDHLRGWPRRRNRAARRRDRRIHRGVHPAAQGALRSGHATSRSLPDAALAVCLPVAAARG